MFNVTCRAFLCPYVDFIFFVQNPYVDYYEHYPIYMANCGVQPCTTCKFGQCNFGSTCKFDHPVQTMRYNLSASSLVDMPVVQYPVGSLLATLAPSSSSSDLRP
ncbi:hypothetical protein ACFX13_032011 [Malus domestica]